MISINYDVVTFLTLAKATCSADPACAVQLLNLIHTKMNGVNCSGVQWWNFGVRLGVGKYYTFPHCFPIRIIQKKNCISIGCTFSSLTRN